MERTHRRPLGLSIGILAAMIANLVLSGSVAASSSSTTLVNGANLAVSLDSPAAGTDYLVGDSVIASGTASVGVGTPDATIVYIVDQSGSTALPGGACGSVLDCEKTFVIGVNDAAATAGSVKNVGLGSFDSAGYSQFGLRGCDRPRVQHRGEWTGTRERYELRGRARRRCRLFPASDRRSTQVPDLPVRRYPEISAVTALHRWRL